MQIFVFINRLKNLKNDTWNYCISVGFNAFVSPLRKGDSVQSIGKPIISATNWGLSWEVFEVVNSISAI